MLLDLVDPPDGELEDGFGTTLTEAYPCEGGGAWDIEDEYSFSGVAAGVPEQLAVLVDGHRSMGRPLCEDAVLRQAIFEEVCKESAKSASKGAPWRLFSGPADLDKEDVRLRAAVTTAAVLSGDTRPPGNLVRIIDAVAQALEGLMPKLDHTAMACSVFGEIDEAETTGHVHSVSVPPNELPVVWEVARGKVGIPSFHAALSERLRHASAVVVLSARPVMASLLAQHISEAAVRKVPPRLSWVHCICQEPPDFLEMREMCVATGGTATAVFTATALRAALELALRPSCSEPSACASSTTSPGITSKLLAKGVASLGPTWWTGQQPVEAPHVAQATTHPAAPPSGHAVRTRSVDAAVVDAVLSRHAEELEHLAPAARRMRIRELVAQEMALRQHALAGSMAARSSEFVVAVLSRALDAPRSVDQRLLLEWLLVLNRIITFCGDIFTLAHAGCVSRLWRDALHRKKSDLAAHVWKWMVRFGEPLPPERRWHLWCWLLARHQQGKPLVARAVDYSMHLEVALHDAQFLDVRVSIAEMVPHLLNPPEQGISLDAASMAGCAQRVSPRCKEGGIGLEQRHAALERVLLAIVARRPTVGPSPGLICLAAFVLSVVEESGIEFSMAEAQAFAFIAGLLELEHIRTWLEPPLTGLRAAVSALTDIISCRLPRLSAHLAAQGVDVQHVSMPWMQTLFIEFAPLPRATLYRMWECWLLDGSPKVFFRIAIAVFAQAEPALLGAPAERMAETLRTFPAPLDSRLAQRSFIPYAWATKVTNSALRPALVAAEANLREGIACTGGSSETGPMQTGAPQKALEEVELVVDSIAGRGKDRLPEQVIELL